MRSSTRSSRRTATGFRTSISLVIVTEPVVGKISEIHRYPIKSMGGERLQRTTLDELGIADDRRYALRDLDSGKILSAKQPSVGRVLLACNAWFTDAGAIELRIGDDVLSADDVSLVDARVSALLGRRAHLELASDADEVYESYWPEMDGLALSDITMDLPVSMSTSKGTFVDLAALHIVTTSSLAHLRSLAAASIFDVARFRPSFVVELGDDVDGFVENDWVGATADLGSARIEFGAASPRCIMTTLAQGDLPDDKAVLRTLSDHNRLDFSGMGNFACLGIYAEVIQPGSVRVGDEFVVHHVANG